MKIKSECYGCNLRYGCAISHWSKVCPCTICLLKPVCCNRCETRRNSADIIRKS